MKKNTVEQLIPKISNRNNKSQGTIIKRAADSWLDLKHEDKFTSMFFFFLEHNVRNYNQYVSQWNLMHSLSKFLKINYPET